MLLVPKEKRTKLQLRSMKCILIGYFDETFAPVYYEDINYLRRMRLAGCRKLIAPGAPGEHLRMATIGSNPEIRESMNDWNGKNEAYYVRKWGPH